MRRRRLITFDSGRSIYIDPPEDILQKLRWYKQGREVSDRRWRDVVGIVRVQGRKLDRGYLTDNAPMLGVASLLARALRDGGLSDGVA